MDIEERFIYWVKKLRIVPFWDIKLEILNDSELNKTGDFKRILI